MPNLDNQNLIRLFFPGAIPYFQPCKKNIMAVINQMIAVSMSNLYYNYAAKTVFVASF